jgi:RNA polymerase sigma-70 factor (ECF subfamily)
MIYEAVFGNDGMLAETSEAARLRSGDPGVLAAVIGRYQHRLYRYFVRLVRDPASADDLFQQTWLQVMRQIHRYDPERSFDTWLFAIAHNVAIDLLRRRPGENLEDYAADTPDALDLVLANERTQHLAAAMEALPALYREALTLRFEEGMKLEEIALVTKTTLSTVKSRVQRGLERLRRNYERP